ncbi:unnamed protein product, partial [Ixodes pacificus]
MQVRAGVSKPRDPQRPSDAGLPVAGAQPGARDGGGAPPRGHGGASPFHARGHGRGPATLPGTSLHRLPGQRDQSQPVRPGLPRQQPPPAGAAAGIQQQQAQGAGGPPAAPHGVQRGAEQQQRQRHPQRLTSARSRARLPQGPPARAAAALLPAQGPAPAHFCRRGRRPGGYPVPSPAEPAHERNHAGPALLRAGPATRPGLFVLLASLFRPAPSPGDHPPTQEALRGHQFVASGTRSHGVVTSAIQGPAEWLRRGVVVVVVCRLAARTFCHRGHGRLRFFLIEGGARFHCCVV